jgi:hypothetical protein
MITKPLSIESFTQMFFEIMLSKTDKVTKISDGSVLNGIGYGIGKSAQKITKDIALIESHIFPDYAFGAYLDAICRMRGVAPRLTATQSSTYVRLFAQPGTEYQAGIHTFTGSHGIVFDLEQNITISNLGFAYAKVRSQTFGSNSNVDSLTLSRVSPTPQGHLYCINEYAATGGRDLETDELLRIRIKEEINLLAHHTISYLESVFRKINPSVLRVFHQGISPNNEVILAISTVNGMDLTLPELDEIKEQSNRWMTLWEIKPNNNAVWGSGVILKNIEYQPIDVLFRVDLDSSYNQDFVRRQIQINLNKYLDYRFWDWTKKVEWDDLLEVVKSTKGVKYVPDNYFLPRFDVKIDNNKLPRIRGFAMYNLSGQIITNLSGTLNPVFYSYYDGDFSFQNSVISSING